MLLPLLCLAHAAVAACSAAFLAPSTSAPAGVAAGRGRDSEATGKTLGKTSDGVAVARARSWGTVGNKTLSRRREGNGTNLPNGLAALRAGNESAGDASKGGLTPVVKSAAVNSSGTGTGASSVSGATEVPPPAQLPLRALAGHQRSCRRHFKEGLFRVLFSEQCLADLELPEMPCPLEHAEGFLQELFGEFHWLSMALSPVFLYFYATVALLGNVPKVEEGGGSTKMLYFVWLMLQVGCILFQLLSMLWYVLGYVNMHWTMGTCFTQVGGAPLAHLSILPVASFQLTAVNKMAPLLITVTVVAMELYDRKEERRAHQVFLGTLFMLGLPMALGLLYSLCSLGFVFSLVFLPAPLLMLATLALLFLLLWVLAHRCKPALKKLEEHFRLDILWFLTDDFEKCRDDLTSVAEVSLVAMLLSPLLSLGSLLAFAVYGGWDGGEVIGLAFDFIFKPMELHLPSFADFHKLISGFPEAFYEVFSQLTGFLRLPPERLLVFGVTAGVLGTVLSLLRSFILSTNTLLQGLREDWGVPCKPVRGRQWKNF